jgi:hypothetical protein
MNVVRDSNTFRATFRKVDREMSLLDMDDYVIAHILLFAPTKTRVIMRATCARIRAIVDDQIAHTFCDPLYEKSRGILLDSEIADSRQYIPIGSESYAKAHLLLRFAMRQRDSRALIRAIPIIWHVIWSRDPQMVIADLYYSVCRCGWTREDVFAVQDHIARFLQTYKPNLSYSDADVDISRRPNDLSHFMIVLAQHSEMSFGPPNFRTMCEICPQYVPSNDIYIPVEFEAEYERDTNFNQTIITYCMYHLQRGVKFDHQRRNMRDTISLMLGRFKTWQIRENQSEQSYYNVGMGYAAKYGRVAKYMGNDVPFRAYHLFRPSDVACAYHVCRGRDSSDYLAQFVRAYFRAMDDAGRSDLAQKCAELLINCGYFSFASRVNDLQGASHHASNMTFIIFLTYARNTTPRDYDFIVESRHSNPERDIVELLFARSFIVRGGTFYRLHGDPFEMMRALVRCYGCKKMAGAFCPRAGIVNDPRLMPESNPLMRYLYSLLTLHG